MCATSDDDAAAVVIVATDVDSRKLSLKQQQKRKEERNHNTLDYTYSRTGIRSSITSECRVREPSNSSYLHIGLLTFTLPPPTSQYPIATATENRLRELKFRCFQNEISSSNGRNDDQRQPTTTTKKRNEKKIEKEKEENKKIRITP